MQNTEIKFSDHVVTALEQSPHFPRRNVEIEASDGRVTLRGMVQTYYQKQMAQEALRLVDGVDEIENQLEVAHR